ncbi:protein SDA1, putative (SDA1) [Plasmodium malariae]|uniref:Protein SDA1, putative (SDA1) n=1 Tax=Plasmodium malariae TaxID=5858 RepID=A0A1A8VNQ1_PLAMA|nr:protein SDA1, putative (SDA1) [Plasmodium malariae]
MNEAKLKRQKFLNSLQHNICKSYYLYHNDFYEQFDKFLFNYSVLLLNPSKKNDLFCNQLSFLSFTCHYFYPQKGSSNSEEEVKGRSAECPSIDIDEYSNVSTGDDEWKVGDDWKLSERFSNHGEYADLLHDRSAKEGKEGHEEVDITDDEMLNENVEQKKKEIWKRMNKEKIKMDADNLVKGRREEHSNILVAYNDLNEYINFLMVRNKKEINYVEELFFLLCQLIVHYKHDLYISVLLSIIKTIRQNKKRVDCIQYLQILIFLSDVNINKIRSYLFKSIIDMIVYTNKKTKEEKIKNEILFLLHEAYIENNQKKRIRKKYSSSFKNINHFANANHFANVNHFPNVNDLPNVNDFPNVNHFANVTISECFNNFACSILIELIKKNIYVNKRNINLIAEGVFYKNEKIVKCVCFALLGKYDNKEFVVQIEKEKFDKNKKIEELKNINNQSHQKLSKSKIKQLHLKKEKIMEQLYNDHHNEEHYASEEENNNKKRHICNYINFLFIDSLFNPYAFASNLFNLICTKYKGNNGTIKLLLLNILCRIYQRNKIVEENFFLYYEHVITHVRNKNTLSKYLSIFLQCIHDYIPPPFIQRILYILVKKFLAENLSEEFVYLIINTIIEIIVKFPQALNEEIYEAVIIFKDYKNRHISILIRRFLNVCKQFNPLILSRKLLDKKTAMLIQKKKILNSAGKNDQEDSLLRYSYLLGGEAASERVEEEEEEEEEDEFVQKGITAARGDDWNTVGSDVEAVDVEADEVEADEVEADEVEADEVEADEVEADEVEADEEEADEVEADEEEADEVEADDGIYDKRRAECKKGGNHGIEEKVMNREGKKKHVQRLSKQMKKEKRKEEKIKREVKIWNKNEKILSERILTDEDFKKLKRMRDYIENNRNVDMSELMEICNAQSNDEDSECSSDEGREKVLTENDLLFKKKIKKSQLIKMKGRNTGSCKSGSSYRFKTNKEKEKKKSSMMLMHKLKTKRKKKNALTQYGKIKKKLKGKLAARAKKRGIIQKRITKKLSRRKR